MNACLKNLFWFVAGWMVLQGKLVAQSDGEQSFAGVMSHVTNFEGLQREADELFATRQRLIEQRDAANDRLQQNGEDFGHIQSSEILRNMQVWESIVRMRLLQLDFARQEMIKASRKGSASHLMAAGIDFTSFRYANVQQQQWESVKSINLGEQIKQLDVASRLIVEHRQKILQQLEEIDVQAQAWFVDYRKLYDKYLDLADVAGLRTAIELKSVLRELERADDENLGAQVTRAITLVRLERIDEALPLIDSLLESPTVARSVAMALRAEVLARGGNRSESQKQLNDLARIKDMDRRAIWLHAQTAQLLSKYSQALTQWNELLRIGSHETAAHRGLALCYYGLSTGTDNARRLQTIALKHAELANQLSGGDDWSCQMALALATDINGDFPQAALLAEAASENALLEKRALCLDFAQQLQEEQLPVWKF